ncbi:MAG: ribosome biogenesis protein [Candidatus Thermoplasmatota archaeon]|nr:ribosome biogenesis protein [Candidatus Thermoplasmatota archaeon]
MLDRCPKCGGTAVYAMPPRFSTNDRFQKYRLMERGGSDGKNNNKAV